MERSPQIAETKATEEPARTEPPVKEPPHPKGRLFEWCAKRKLAAPTFDLTPGPQGFEARVRVALTGDVTLESALHVGRSIKSAQNAACMDVFEQIEQQPEIPAATPPKPKRSADEIAALAEARALREAQAQAAAKQKILEERAAAREKAREAREQHVRGLLETSSPTTALKALQELRGLQWIRRFAVAAQSRGRGLSSLSITAWLERPDGSQIHVPPFVAASREEGDRIACAQLLESLARIQGVSRARK